MPNDRLTAMVFSGGLGLASYHAGAFQAFHERRYSADWLAGASAGAVTAAVVAGNSPETAISRLSTFWNMPGSGARPIFDHPWRHIQAWASAASSRVFGSSGHFRPRIPVPLGFRSLYDLGTMRERLRELIDFGRLNSGETRVSVAATDLESGDPVIFDTEDGPLEMDHLLASCGFLPTFAPVEIDGRTYVDGGLSLNAPFDSMLDDSRSIRLFIVDLFPRDGALPRSLEAAAERKIDLMFGNQTFLRLKLHLELRSLKRGDRALGPSDEIFYLSYRSDAAEPGRKNPSIFPTTAWPDAGAKATPIWPLRWILVRSVMEYCRWYAGRPSRSATDVSREDAGSGGVRQSVRDRPSSVTMKQSASRRLQIASLKKRIGKSIFRRPRADSIQGDQTPTNDFGLAAVPRRIAGRDLWIWVAAIAAWPVATAIWCKSDTTSPAA